MGRLLKRKRILSDRAAELRAREAELLERLSVALSRFDGDVAEEDRQRFEEAREQLDGLFLLVVAGEFNSGKSSFINALLGERVLPEGVTPTTDRINLLEHGNAVTETPLRAYLLRRTHPAPLLRDLNIVDTPGTNAVIRQHEELTRNFVPRSDLVLFITSADRPFTESERVFLEQIRAWGKKVVLIINKSDILGSDAEREQVTAFVRDNAVTLLGQAPRIFALSARQALAARENDDDALWRTSGFDALENFLLRELDQEERIRLKLLNPLDVGLRLAARYKAVAFERLKQLTDDIATIETIDQQLAAFHEEMLHDLKPHLSSLEVLLQQMEARGLNFFDDTLRLRRIRDLMRSDLVRREFEKVVIADTPQRLDQEVHGIIDWIVERNLKVWQDIQNYIDRRRLEQHRDRMVGEVGQSFDYNRQALLNSVGRAAREAVDTYNREAEAQHLSSEVRDAFATTALAEVGAVGIGAALVTVLTGAAADVTGVVLAAAVAVGGLYVIPNKRRKVKADFKKKISEMRGRVMDALTRQVQSEVSHSTSRINESIAPYRRFVKAQQDSLNEARAELVATEDAMMRLREEVEGQGQG